MIELPEAVNISGHLLIEFDDHSALSASVQMYGGIGVFPEGKLDNIYYRVAKEKPSPLTQAFDRTYFYGIIFLQDVQKLSLKALLATGCMCVADSLPYFTTWLLVHHNSDIGHSRKYEILR